MEPQLNAEQVQKLSADSTSPESIPPPGPTAASNTGTGDAGRQRAEPRCHCWHRGLCHQPPGTAARKGAWHNSRNFYTYLETPLWSSRELNGISSPAK